MCVKLVNAHCLPLSSHHYLELGFDSTEEEVYQHDREVCTMYVRYAPHVELIRDLTHMLSSFVNLVMRIK